jgi:NADPH:quinone reductase-like Zn-dependent oxidoreductase
MTKSVVFTEYGPADVLHIGDAEVPEPGPGQVRIAVRASGVNPFDHKVRAGAMKQVYPLTFPHVPGLEGAGVIDALGEGVTGLTLGDPVFGSTVTGSYAELALAPAAKVTLKPDTLSWEQAVALPVAAETSYRSLELLGVRPGETLLIHAAAGGVGQIAVQLAVARGVKVLGTASERNHEFLRSLGAVPVRYGDGLVERVRAAAPDGVDAALDLSGQGGVIAASVELTGGKDRVLTVANPAEAAEHGVRFSSGGDGPYLGIEAVKEALALQAAGRLTVHIHHVYPLAEAAAAHRESEAGHVTGKIVLTV